MMTMPHVAFTKQQRAEDLISVGAYVCCTRLGGRHVMFFSGGGRCQSCSRKKPCGCGLDPAAEDSTVVERLDVTSELVIGSNSTAVDKFRELRKWKQFEFDDLTLMKAGASDVESRNRLDLWPPVTINRYRSRHPPSAGCVIPLAEDRGITLRQLLAIAQYVEKHCVQQQWSGSRPYNQHTEDLPWLEEKPIVVGSFGKIRLTPQDVCLADLSAHVLIPAIEGSHCSVVEWLADSAADQKPRWFVSHWWSEPFLPFVACLLQHAFGRYGAIGPWLDVPYWISGIATNNPQFVSSAWSLPFGVEMELEVIPAVLWHRQRTLGRLMRADKDGDGVVDRAEFKAAGGKKEEFDRYDADGDGVLDKNELKNLIQDRSEADGLDSKAFVSPSQ